MRAAFVALLVVAFAAPARADAKPDDSTVGVIVQGGGSLRDKIEQHITKRVRREGYTAVDAPLGRDALNTISNCFILEDLVCARGVVEARGKTPRLIFVRIDDSGGTVSLSFTWFSRGHEPIPAKSSCSNCAGTWQDHTDDLVSQLMSGAEMPIGNGPEPEPEIIHKGHSRLLPTLLISAGAATLVTGGALLYYGLRDGATHKYVYPQLTPVGITMIAVGGGAMIGGIITW